VRRIKRIMHPAGFSEVSAKGFHLARELARDYQATLVVRRVAPPTAKLAERVDSGLANGHLSDLQLTLSSWVAETDAPGVRTRLAEGGAAWETVRVAQEEGCDLIVLGTHCRAGVRRVLMGGVAVGVSRKTPLSGDHRPARRAGGRGPARG
jgi:nucleotide-binding universal stress UspA family protein